MTKLLDINIDELWGDAPDTPIRALDTAIAFLERLVAAIDTIDPDPDERARVTLDAAGLGNLWFQALELSGNLDDLRDELRPEDAASRVHVRKFKIHAFNARWRANERRS